MYTMLDDCHTYSQYSIELRSTSSGDRWGVESELGQIPGQRLPVGLEWAGPA